MLVPVGIAGGCWLGNGTDVRELPWGFVREP